MSFNSLINKLTNNITANKQSIPEITINQNDLIQHPPDGDISQILQDIQNEQNNQNKQYNNIQYNNIQPPTPAIYGGPIPTQTTSTLPTTPAIYGGPIPTQTTSTLPTTPAIYDGPTTTGTPAIPTQKI